MELKSYLVDTFRYNDHANKLALAKIRELPDAGECVRLFSHLILCMDKWLARIEAEPEYWKLDWWTPVYPLEELEPAWDKCMARWMEFINAKSDGELEREVTWFNPDVQPRGTAGGSEKADNFAASIRDIALQLNYHSIHHRGQIQMLIRAQGVEPDFVDYIGTRYRRLDVR